jgi:hypothetical protein
VVRPAAEYSENGLSLTRGWPGTVTNLLPAFQHVPTFCSEDCPPTSTREWMDHLKEMAPSAFSFLKLFSLATKRFIRKGISKYGCFTAIRWHWHWIEKALKMAINHLIYVGSDLRWYGSSYHPKWLSFILPIIWGLLQCTPLTNRHGSYGQLVIVNKNWFPKPNILNPIQFS